MNPWLFFAVKVAVIVLVLLTGAAYATLAERRVSAFMQDRFGPNRVGPFGLLQPLLDVVKLAFKEEVIPDGADRLIFRFAPGIVMATAVGVVSVIPFDPRFTITDFDAGAVLVLAVVGLGAYGVMLGGYASPSKYSMIGSLRSMAQTVSYELAMALAVVGVVIGAASMSLVSIVEAQSTVPFALTQFVGFAVFMVATFAETNRLPFDMPEAEAELVGGYHTEYSSLRFGWFFAGEYASLIVASCMVTTLYLGGWNGPFAPGGWWFALKVVLLLLFFIVVRWTFPRVRYDQLMALGWKVLLPLSAVNLFAVAVVKVVT